jgi:GntR family transcriptional repressor for pyruvate dehydrogenase complex
MSGEAWHPLGSAVARNRPDPAQRPAFEPTAVKQRRAFEGVCDQIRGAVERGELVPGDRLPPERDLCTQFRVSRTAVREALRSLEVAGIIHCQQGMGGGSFIKKGDSDVVVQAVQDMVLLGQIPTENITDARILLTGVAIRLACQKGTEADFDAIERDIDKSAELTRRGDFSRRTTYITEFYRVLARATHNEIIVMLLDSLSEVVRTLMAKVSPVPRTDVVDVRRKILAHLRERDAESAISEMSAHLESLNEYLKQQEAGRNLGAASSGEQMNHHAD